jgi:cell division transport system permease protein
MLPLVVAAMTFLAALALAGALAAAGLAQHWQQGAATAVTVQVPNADVPLPRRADGPEETRLDAVLKALRASRDVASMRVLSASELSALLRPWLGTGAESAALPLPSVIEVHLVAGIDDVTALAAALDQAAPGTLTESHGVWVGRLQVLARSVQACAWAAVLVVALVAAAMVMVATRAGLASRREAIEIVHGLGATDGYIALRFAGRITRHAMLGGVLGVLVALPVLIVLADLAAPFMFVSASPDFLASLQHEHPIWLAVPALPLAFGLIGYLTAQATVRGWLRKLP